MLADIPLVGKVCENIKTGNKKLPIGRHVIFYKEGTNASIEVVRILHRRMDVDLNFQDP